MKLVFFALGVAVGGLFFSKKQKADMPKGFSKGGYVQRPAHAEPKFVLVDERESLGDIHLNHETLNKIREHLKNRNLDR